MTLSKLNRVRVDQRFILALFWSAVAAAMLFIILFRFGHILAILTLIIGLVGGTILGSIFGTYFAGAHGRKDESKSTTS